MKESSRKVRVAARKSAYKKPPAKPAAVPKPAEPEVDAIKAWKARWRVGLAPFSSHFPTDNVR